MGDAGVVDDGAGRAYTRRGALTPPKFSETLVLRGDPAKKHTPFDVAHCATSRKCRAGIIVPSPYRRLAELDRRLGGARPQVEHLHEHGKGHGEVDVALGDIDVEPLGDQGHPDQ